MKKYVIIKPNCRELANHLWNYLSIYACGIETGARVQNPSFVKWHRYFNLSEKESFLTRMIARIPFLHRVWKVICVLYGSYLIRFCAKCVRLTLGITTYLPPTRALRPPENACEALYFIGWHFRNPLGLARHRDALLAAFSPKERILKKIESLLAPLHGKRLIGIRLRQQPYKGFPGGDFIVPASRIRRIVDEYLREKKISATDVALVLVSDAPVDPDVFRDFTIHISREDEVTNLFLLSKCSVLMGDNSASANLAAWFGNVPHLVATNELVDWEYYGNRSEYFENKYATLAQ